MGKTHFCHAEPFTGELASTQYPLLHRSIKGSGAHVLVLNLHNTGKLLTKSSSSSSSSVSLENVLVCVQFQLDTPIGYLAQSATWIWASWLFCHQGRKLLAGKLQIIMSPPLEGSPSQPAPSTTSPDAPSATLVSFHLGSNLKEKKYNLQIYL